jgi:hypothetical protein
VRESNTSQADAQGAQTRSRTFERRRTDTATLFALETWYCLKPRFPLVVGLRIGRRMLCYSSFNLDFFSFGFWRQLFLRDRLALTGRLAVNVRPLSANKNQTLIWQKRFSTSRASVIVHGFILLSF